MTTEDFLANPKVFASKVHQTAVDHGFWELDRSDAEAIALMHSELSEAWSNLKQNSPPDDHIVEYPGKTAELADVIIRICDTCTERDYRVFDLLEVLLIEKIPQRHWRNEPEALLDIHESLSEALESIRHGHPKSEKYPEYTNTELAFAMCIVHTLDFAAQFDLQIAGALVAKAEYNKSRPYKHGKQF